MILAKYFVKRKANRMARHIKKSFGSNSDFNVKQFDDNVEKLAQVVYSTFKPDFLSYSSSEPDSVATLATKLYNVGGHTPCLINFIRSFYQSYNVKCFLTRKDHTINVSADEKMHLIRDLVTIKGINLHKRRVAQNIIELFNLIISENPRVIFLYIHKDDVVATAVVALVKQYTNIKVIFFNHSDHLPVLGMKFADLIIDARPTGKYVTQQRRGYNNSTILPLQSQPASATKYYSEDILMAKRSELGVSKDSYLTLSGFSSYKMFAGNASSYILLIRDLLILEPKLKHVLITELSPKQKSIVEEAFLNHKEERLRLTIITRISNFDILLQASDLFIDSFPIGSALVHIDMMRNKRPTVIKVNHQNPIYSFEDYLPRGYSYAFACVDSLREGILELLRDRKKQKKIAAILYKHYLNTFEFDTVKSKYKRIIENSDNLEQFYA